MSGSIVWSAAGILKLGLEVLWLFWEVLQSVCPQELLFPLTCEEREIYHRFPFDSRYFFIRPLKASLSNEPIIFPQLIIRLGKILPMESLNILVCDQEMLFFKIIHCNSWQHVSMNMVPILRFHRRQNFLKRWGPKLNYQLNFVKKEHFKNWKLMIS